MSPDPPYVGYFSEEDLKGQVPADFLDQLTDDGNASGAANLLQLRKDACIWVDGYLSRFNPPLAIDKNASQQTLDILRIHSVIVFKWMLEERKAMPGAYKNPSEAFQATKAFLTSIQKGAPLPGAYEPAPPPPPAPGDVTGSSTGGEIVFTADSAVL